MLLAERRRSRAWVGFFAVAAAADPLSFSGRLAERNSRLAIDCSVELAMRQ